MQSWAGSGGRAVCVMATLTSAGHLGVICGFRVVNTYSRPPVFGLLVSSWRFFGQPEVSLPSR